MGDPVIAPLADAREAAAVAEWIWTEWARHEPGVSRADSDATVHAALQGGDLPRFFVARAGGVPVGCASIVANDLPTRPDLGPWLANVYVRPEWRGCGLGTALAAQATAYGAQLGDVLYLYTAGSTALYTRLGWRAFDTGHYAGRPIEILRYDVSK